VAVDRRLSTLQLPFAADARRRANQPAGSPVRIVAIALLVLAGCSGQSDSARSYPGYATGSQSFVHIVEPGETVYHIAQTYGVSADRLMTANGIGDPRELRVGQSLIIPGHHWTAGVQGTGEPAMGLTDPWDVAPAGRQFAWPVANGTVSSPFGMRNGVMHSGIDIAAAQGTPILAADSGTVVLAGRLRGYGDVVIIQHSGGYVTVYGHNQRNLASTGESVARGQEIAEMGMTGRATGPNLHFEVRRGNQAQNPLAYLPPPGPAGGISFARNSGS